jgi:hypothetical protein
VSETSDARDIGSQGVNELLCGELRVWYALSIVSGYRPNT